MQMRMRHAPSSSVKSMLHDTVLYTLRKSFFPTEGIPPFLFDVFTTINVENIHNIMCKDPSFEFGSRTTDPPTMRGVW